MNECVASNKKIAQAENVKEINRRRVERELHCIIAINAIIKKKASEKGKMANETKIRKLTQHEIRSKEKKKKINNRMQEENENEEEAKIERRQTDGSFFCSSAEKIMSNEIEIETSE